MVKLYDKFIIIFTVHIYLKQNAGKVEPWGKINFDFDLVFEILRPDNSEESQIKKSGLKGIKFERGE
jgi:hypothetical protein